MALYVQKYGGSSVATPKQIRSVAERVLRTRRAGHDVVVVVSAMGDTTDHLIDLANQIHALPQDREMDLLLATGEQISVALLTMALHALDAEAVGLTGPQAGIYTDPVHTKAKILRVEPARIVENLRKGRIVVVAGFQGLTPDSDVATLGRGGSDTTAVALATALRADRCQFYKDVPGVFTANPRIVPAARKLDEIAYDEMLELAGAGAEVLQSRAVEFAKKYGVTLEVLSSTGDEPGTLVKEEVNTMEGILVRGIAVDKKQAEVTVTRLPDEPGAAARVFRRLAEAHINVDMIVHNVSEAGFSNLSFTVPKAELARTHKILRAVQTETGAADLLTNERIAMVSIVGVGMRSHSGVAFAMFDALARHGINIELISTSEIKIAVVIEESHADEAARALHQAFGLSAAPAKRKSPAKSTRPRGRKTAR
jgi:aspartate kinase